MDINYSTVYNWTSFCGVPNITVWDYSTDNFGLCFQKLVFGSGGFSLLAISSAFYIGKHFPTVSRSNDQNSLIVARILIVLLLLVLSVIHLFILIYVTTIEVFWVDILTFSTQILGWTIHLVFMTVLRKHLSRSTRGPSSIIIAWTFTLLYQILFLKTAFNIYNEMKIHDFNLNLYITRGLISAGLVLQLFYLGTLFPKGQLERENLSEHTPLLGRRNNRLEDAFDDIDLGQAELGCTTFSYLTFHWVNQLMKKGSQGGLESVDDVFELPPYLKTESISQKVQNTLMLSQPLITDDVTGSQPKDHLLLRALHRCFGRPFYAIGVLKLFGDCLAFAGPLLLREFLLYLEVKHNTSWSGYIAGAAICFTSFLACMCTVHYNYYLAKIDIQIKSALITSIFRKIQHMNEAMMSEFSTGEIITLMSTDTDRVVNFCKAFHAFWSLPLQMAITIYLLYHEIGISFLAVFIFAILLVPINRFLAVKIGHLSKRMMHFKDRRVHLISEALDMIKAIKFNAWENIFQRKIMDERFGEVKALAGRKYLDAACVYFWATTPVLIPIITFGTYAALGNEMEPSRIFTAVSLFNMLIMPLNAFPWAINGLVEAWISIKRIEKLMQVNDHVLNDYYTVVPEMSVKGSDLQVVMLNASFSWSPNTQSLRSSSSSQVIHNLSSLDEEEGAVAISPSSGAIQKRRNHCSTMSSITQEPLQSNDVPSVLTDLNIHIKKNQIVGIVGDVGSGKTSLLFAIAGELEKVNGVVAVAGLHNGFAFAPQKPWLQNTSIKENIVFGQNFDPSRYRSVLHACALEEDLQILAKGENTRCGENGASLSGGQRARVALARTVYQNKTIYLLDDVLSAVDYKVANQILQRLIHGFLIGKTVVLVTHHLQMLTRADLVIHLKDKTIQRQGPAHEILSRLGVDISVDETLDDVCEEQAVIPRLKLKSNWQSVDFKLPRIESAEDTAEAEGRAYGGLSCSVYMNYLSAVGVALCFAIFLSIALMQTARNLSDVWLAIWVSKSAPPSNESAASGDMLWVPLSHPTSFFSDVGGIFPDVIRQLFNYQSNSRRSSSFVDEIDETTKFYLTVYALLAISHSVFTLGRSFLFAYGGLNAARSIHTQLLDAVLNTKIGFFDNNPLGRILNRFSSDIYTIDDSLPFQANIFFAKVFGLVGCLCITLYGMPWILLLYLPLMVVYYNIQQYYRHTSRDLRRIFALSLSPLYNHFIETLNGSPVIRALRSGHRFGLIGDAYLEQNQRAQFCLDIVSQWLNFRLQLIGVGILAAVVILALLQHHLSEIDAGLVGLVVAYALTINEFLNGVVTSLTETERELVSMERVNQYLSGAEKEGKGEFVNPLLALPFGWPSSSSIKLVNVSLKYHFHTPYSLRNVNLEVASCEKVGIVGRTGAGKSSIFVALFRLVKLNVGRIYIDGVDIADISIKKLRNNLSIISQDVLLFSGTVRENLDPKCQNTDDSIAHVIQQCHLTSVVEDLGGLDGTLTHSGRNLSAGQQQLFCFARALLGRTKIVCIDEGSSSLDYEMDLKIQNIMRDSFRNKTVLIIAHRIHTVRDCDRVVVMDEGQIVEIGRPLELLEDPNSLFHSIFQ